MLVGEDRVIARPVLKRLFTLVALMPTRLNIPVVQVESSCG